MAEQSHIADADAQLAELDAKRAAAEKDYRRNKRVLLEAGIQYHTLCQDWVMVAKYQRLLGDLKGD